ncbi:outer membrane protein assembly factor BamA [Candidatus Ruminimicrobiellum ovillum]|uniref:outer membrane protein assembly factor BamA n=1 Tax=Candidatus Ruminimicrobiellum ovillum TaxID=1947927 RepID=UPI00355AC31A
MKKFFLAILFIFISVPALFADDDTIFRIKDVVFDGLQNVKPKTVRSEIQLKKGKVYAASVARDDLRTILGLGYFEDASLSVDKENKIVKFKLDEKPYIKKIVFKGNKQFSVGKLKGEITLKEKDFYNFVELEESKRKILTLYKDKGYADCQMEVYPTTDEDTNTMTITFLITENNKVLVGDLYVEGVRSFKNKKIKKLAKTKKKKVFKEETLKNDMASIKKFYLNRGFMDFSIDEPEIAYDDARTKMFITLRVNEGARYKMGDIDFEGNYVISSKDLSKHSTIKKNEIFNQEKILELLNKVYDDYSNRGYLHSYIAPDFSKSNDNLMQEGLSSKKTEKEVLIQEDIDGIDYQLDTKINQKSVDKKLKKLNRKLERTKYKTRNRESEVLNQNSKEQDIKDKIADIDQSLEYIEYSDFTAKQREKLEKKKAKLEKKLLKAHKELEKRESKVLKQKNKEQLIQSDIDEVNQRAESGADFVLTAKQEKKLEKKKVKLEKQLVKAEKEKEKLIAKEKKKLEKQEKKLEKQNKKEEKLQEQLDAINEQIKEKREHLDIEDNLVIDINGNEAGKNDFADKKLKKLQKKKTKIENKIAKFERKKIIENVVNVDFNIQENNIVYVGDIYVDGLTNTKDNTIRREILLMPGDVFSSGKVRRSMEKIYNLGFIDGAEPNIAPTGQPDIMNLAFSITEGKPGMITAGAGYSSVDKFVGSIQLQHMNLFGRAQKLNLLWEFGARRQNYEIDWTEPWFLGKAMSLGLSLYNIERLRDYHNTSDAYREGRLGGSVSISPRVDDKIALLFGYTYEHVRIFDIDDDELKEEIMNDPDLAKDRTSSVRAQIVYDTRDYIYDASKGARYSYGISVAGGPLGGNVNYVRNSVRGTWFFPTFWKFVLSVNINTGWIESYGSSSDVPLYEKYYVGGADTIRGYKYRTEVGPYNGGKVMAVANVEYKFPIVQENKRTILQGAFFYDIGGTWKDINHIKFAFGTDNDETNSYYLKSGFGFGIRFATPVFPLRLDWGYGLNHKRGEDLQQFYFTIGNVF